MLDQLLSDESGAEAEFRTSVRAFFTDAGLPPAAVGERESTWAALTSGDIARAKEFQGRLFDAGFAGLRWPTEFGGQGLGLRHQLIFDMEAARFSLPTGPLGVGLGMCGPTVLSHGTSSQKRRYLRPLLRGEELWAQLFSEPEAGSDVAALRTKAEQTRGSWRLSGQKVWTSGAQHADLGLALARTDPHVPKHQGISMFIVDLRAPGIDIRPLRQMTGQAKFAEVFLDGVEVPDADRVGPVGGGWRCSITTLMSERYAVGGSSSRRGGSAALLIEAARARGLGADGVLRQRLADIWIRERIVDCLNRRVLEAVLAGRQPGPEGSISKLVSSLLIRRAAALGADIVGQGSVAWSAGDEGGGAWAERLLGAPGLAIGGGTDEILKNVIGERVLGLPKERTPDHDEPFSALLERTFSGNRS